MTRYLDTQEISAKISNIIKEAKDDLILISPYLQINELLKEKIKGKSNNSNNLRIRIIYGKNEKNIDKDLKWLNEIEDLKILYKKNLHGKCYLNENEAIITSMNLYEFSEKNNIEMGVLISREKDPETYKNMYEDIRFMITNSTTPHSINKTEIIKDKKKEIIEINNNEEIKLTLEQKKKIEILKEWRYFKSKELKQPVFTIFKNSILEQISINNIKTREDLKKIKGIAEKKINSFGNEILEVLRDSKKYQIVKILETFTQYNTIEGYDRIKIKNLINKEEKWLDTTKELPLKNSIVAVRINKNWFNNYIILEL